LINVKVCRRDSQVERSPQVTANWKRDSKKERLVESARVGHKQCEVNRTENCFNQKRGRAFGFSNSAVRDPAFKYDSQRGKLESLE